VVTITDDVLAPAWRTSFLRHGLYPFAPIPLVETGSRVRMAGDGPSGWTCWIVVAPYVVPGDRAMNSNGGTDRIVGGKPLLAMQCIVADYSRRGGLVVDPTSGAGTTGRAAKAQGRRFIGLEIDPGRAELSAKALASVSLAQGELFQIDGREVPPQPETIGRTKGRPMTDTIPPVQMLTATCGNCTHWVPSLRSRHANICFVRTMASNPEHDWGDAGAHVVLTGSQDSCDKFRRRSS
jgi:hypothetical protein